jgi:hypothetical protein
MPCRITERSGEAWQKERAAKEREQRQQETRHREVEAAHRRRLAAIEQEWHFFKLGMQQAQREQQQQAELRHRQQLMDEISALIRPPQPQEPTLIYVEEGTGRLGHSDCDPALMARPLRWW